MSGPFTGIDFASSGKDLGYRKAADKSNTFDEKPLVVVSVVEARGRDVTICRLCTSSRYVMEIYCTIDSHSYIETLLLLEDIRPDEILISESTKTSILTKKIATYSANNECRINFINRQYFDQDLGADVLRRVGVGHMDTDLISKYTVLAGSHCLIKYIENSSGSHFGQHSLRMVYVNNANTRMAIDRRTAMCLELVSNMTSRSASESLFGSINQTVTAVGARTLRSNILRPLTDVHTIECRLDLVELLLRNPSIVDSIKNVLKQFPELDKMLSGIASVSKAVTYRAVRRSIDDLIALKQTLKCCRLLNVELLKIRSMFEAPEEKRNNEDNFEDENDGDQLPDDLNHGHEGNDGSDNVLNRIIASTISILSCGDLQILSQKANSYISDSTTYSKSSVEMQHQECFAISPGVNGNLDIVRKLYLQTVEDIYEEARGYETELGVSVKVVYNSSRNYHLVLPASLNPLPTAFTQAVFNKKGISCSTDEILSKSDRCQEMLAKALHLTYDILRSLSDFMREQMEIMLAVVDAVALLDMLTSFASVVRGSQGSYTRPVLTKSTNNEDVMVLQAARHPIICSQYSSKRKMHGSSFVSNDSYIGPEENVQIITGANGSGKTIFIKQVALIVILAQIGCYVPCQHATISIRDRILSRIGTSDDIETNLSTFASEMSETSYILSNITPRSLILIDELGRGTSNIDGISIAIAVVEALTDSQAYTLFVTHYPQVTKLATMYGNVRNVHLTSTIKLISNSGNDGSSAGNTFGSDIASIYAPSGVPSSSSNCGTGMIVGSGSSGNRTGNIFGGAARGLESPRARNLNGSNSSSSSNSNNNVDDNNINDEVGHYRCDIQYHHKLTNGPCDMTSGYGIIMAEICGFPASIISDARSIHRTLKNQETLLLCDDKGRPINDEQEAVDESSRLLYDMMDQGLGGDSSNLSSKSSNARSKEDDEVQLESVLTQLLRDIQIVRSSKLDDEALLSYLGSLQLRYCNNDRAVQSHLLSFVEKLSSNNSISSSGSSSSNNNNNNSNSSFNNNSNNNGIYSSNAQHHAKMSTSERDIASTANPAQSKNVASDPNNITFRSNSNSNIRSNSSNINNSNKAISESHLLPSLSQKAAASGSEALNEELLLDPKSNVDMNRKVKRNHGDTKDPLSISQSDLLFETPPSNGACPKRPHLTNMTQTATTIANVATTNTTSDITSSNLLQLSKEDTSFVRRNGRSNFTSPSSSTTNSDNISYKLSRLKTPTSLLNTAADHKEEEGLLDDAAAAGNSINVLNTLELDLLTGSDDDNVHLHKIYNKEDMELDNKTGVLNSSSAINSGTFSGNFSESSQKGTGTSADIANDDSSLERFRVLHNSNLLLKMQNQQVSHHQHHHHQQQQQGIVGAIDTNANGKISKDDMLDLEDCENDHYQSNRTID